MQNYHELPNQGASHRKWESSARMESTLMKHTVCHRLVFLRFSLLCLCVRACVHVCTSFIFLQSKPFATLHKLLLSPISYPFLIFLLHSISHINGTCAIHIILECNASILTIARVCVCVCVCRCRRRADLTRTFWPLKFPGKFHWYGNVLFTQNHLSLIFKERPQKTMDACPQFNGRIAR